MRGESHHEDGRYIDNTGIASVIWAAMKQRPSPWQDGYPGTVHR